MKKPTDDNRNIADVIGQRVRVGPDPLVSGWQQMLTDFLVTMKPYLTAGRLVTFQSLRVAEKEFFGDMVGMVSVPETSVALYLPPSVREQMMATDRGAHALAPADPDPDALPDAGVVLAARDSGFDVILNALFARPPHLAAVDIYDSGQLISGYTYATIRECQENLSDLMQTYLG